MFTTNPYSMGTKDAGSLAMLQALLGGQGGMPQQGGQMNSLAQAQTAPLMEPGEEQGAFGGAIEKIGRIGGQAMLGRQRNAMQKELLGITDPEQAEALRQRIGGMDTAMGFLGR